MEMVKQVVESLPPFTNLKCASCIHSSNFCKPHFQCGTFDCKSHIGYLSSLLMIIATEFSCFNSLTYVLCFFKLCLLECPKSNHMVQDMESMGPGPPISKTFRKMIRQHAVVKMVAEHS
jgi:hypothetical protein